MHLELLVPSWPGRWPEACLYDSHTTRFQFIELVHAVVFLTVVFPVAAVVEQDCTPQQASNLERPAQHVSKVVLAACTQLENFFLI